MSGRVCRAAAIALTGLDGTAVLVEAAVSQQLPGMAIIGLPDTALAEAKLRVRTATAQAGLPLSDRFLTINLSPASIPKHGSGFDLAIALAALAASGRLPAERLPGTAHIGELGLDGSLRRPAGLLSAVLSAKRLGFETVMVPEACAREASLVPGIRIVVVPDLGGAVAWHRGEDRGWRIQSSQHGGAGIEAGAGAGARTGTGADGGAGADGETGSGIADGEPCGERTAPDISDVVGQPEAVEALTIAAAGRHHLSMVGPPGAGKTMLAMRLPTILPDLTPEESLTASSIASLGGSPLTALVRRPPFESPHHTASAVSLVGGGDGRGVRPGAITRACYGVLFLDEAPEFSRAALDNLRESLESGTVEIHRARVRTSLPARVQLILAANPCPCGNAGSPDRAAQCTCTPHTRMRYRQRISGPLNDRIDLRLSLRRVSSVLPRIEAAPRATSAELRARVTAARSAAAERLRGTPWSTNAEVSGTWLRGAGMRLPAGDTAVIDRAMARGALTARGYDRTLRIAWTIADLRGAERPGRDEIARALALRGGDRP